MGAKGGLVVIAGRNFLGCAKNTRLFCFHFFRLPVEIGFRVAPSHPEKKNIARGKICNARARAEGEIYIRHAKKEQLAKQISSLPFPPHKGETNFGFPRKRAGDTKTRRFLLLARSVFSALARSSIFGKFIRPLEEGRNTRRVVAPTHERWNAMVYFFSRPCIPCFLHRVFFAIAFFRAQIRLGPPLSAHAFGQRDVAKNPNYEWLTRKQSGRERQKVNSILGETTSLGFNQVARRRVAAYQYFLRSSCFMTAL